MESNSPLSSPEPSGVSDSRDGSPSAQEPSGSSRRTTHARDRGGIGYGMSVAWAQFRPFLPFILISCLVVALIYLLNAIVYSGPFTDPLFFQKFEQRWPKPGRDQSSQEPIGAKENATD